MFIMKKNITFNYKYMRVIFYNVNMQFLQLIKEFQFLTWVDTNFQTKNLEFLEEAEHNFAALLQIIFRSSPFNNYFQKIWYYYYTFVIYNQHVFLLFWRQRFPRMLHSILDNSSRACFILSYFILLYYLNTIYNDDFIIKLWVSFTAIELSVSIVKVIVDH